MTFRKSQLLIPRPFRDVIGYFQDVRRLGHADGRR
jgi:hypothetical protein